MHRMKPSAGWAIAVRFAGRCATGVSDAERPKLVITPRRGTGKDPPLYTFDLTITRG